MRVLPRLSTSVLAAFFAPGTGVLSKTESEDENRFTRGLCNSMSCEEEPTRIL